MNCPPKTFLQAYLQGEIADNRRDALERHLADCERCGEVLARLNSAEENPTSKPKGLVHPSDLVDVDQDFVQPHGAIAACGLDLKPGAEPVPDYHLVKWIGKGGFGQVWEATAPGGRPVALKIIAREGGRSEKEQQALALMSKVRHPHLLTISAFWPREHSLIIAMELADRTLHDRFKEVLAEGQRGIPKEELLVYMAEAAEPIDFLNEQHLIQHRDIKPANLLLLGGSIKVGDFGLARLLEHYGTGHSLSLTPEYAAPEFFLGNLVPGLRQSDQYSLAVTYCHMRGGRLPFIGTMEEIGTGHIWGSGKPDLSMLAPEEQVVVARALSKLAQDRWPSCLRFVEELCF